MIANLQDYLNRLIWGKELTRAGMPERALAVVLRYLYAMLRDFFSGQLTMRAMNLVYTTLLSVVPLLAFSFAILKGFGKFDDIVPYFVQIFAPPSEEGEVIIQQILAFVDNVKGSVLGGAGFVIFLYTAISTVQKVEESFNYVWYVAKPRNLHGVLPSI